jgi:uncharacterized protein YaaR (DUF327 family)
LLVNKLFGIIQTEVSPLFSKLIYDQQKTQVAKLCSLSSTLDGICSTGTQLNPSKKKKGVRKQVGDKTNEFIGVLWGLL